MELSDSHVAQPVFEAPAVPVDTLLRFQLVVSDGNSNSPPDTVDVVVEDAGGNVAPVADAGADQTVVKLDEVTLDGTGSSDPDGDALTYGWVQTGGPSVNLSDTQGDQPWFVAPQVSEATTLSFELVVNDGEFDSASDSVSVVVNPASAGTCVTDKNRDHIAAGRAHTMWLVVVGQGMCNRIW